MPKFTKIQTNFTAGEISQSIWGRIDNERYDSALQTCFNYLPLVQGPIIRRPGTKYVGNVKDSTKPGILVPFQISATQAYNLEFGDKYLRFFSNDGQVLITGSVFIVVGNFPSISLSAVKNYKYWFSASRLSSVAQPGENIGSVITPVAGVPLEITSPYSYADLSGLKFVQNNNTMFITHPNYPPFKLVRQSGSEWAFKPVALTDGPYLPLNSYQSLADSASINLTTPSFNNPIFLSTDPIYQITGVSNNGAGLIRVTTANTTIFQTGSKVFIEGVAGTAEANNVGAVGGDVVGTSTIVACTAWVVNSISTNTFDLLNSTFTNNYTGSGSIRPALFVMSSTGIWADGTALIRNFSSFPGPTDAQRVIGLYQNGQRFWGNIVGVVNAGQAAVGLITGTSGISANSTSFSVWQMGTYSGLNGFPNAQSLHQNRLYFAGCANSVQQFDGSVIGQFETFSLSGSSLQVTDQNAVQFSMASQEIQPIYWLKPSSQGLLAGTLSGEWQISPSNQNIGITPTNISAQQLAGYGSANLDSIVVSNQVIYLQKAQRKVRELNYFFQAGTFRSTNISELAEHLTLPSITKLANQKEINPAIWALRSDGQLLSLTYNRDDFSLKAGWARHQLGGQSDSAGTPPVVKSISVITASSGFYDELWCTVQRSVNGSNVVTVEYLTRPFDYTSLQEDAYYLDCGASYDSPISVTGITNASSCVVTAPNHGLLASSTIRFYQAIGLNSSIVDANGNTSITNLVNGNTFIVASTSTNSFKIQDFFGNDINSKPYTSYLGSAVVRKLISLVTGVNWLAGDTVSILADGGIATNTTVSNVGSVGLSFPAAKVHIGYGYNSDGQLLRTHDGSAQGTSIGSTRRVNRVAFMLHNVAEFNVGPTFTNLLPVEFPRADLQNADNPVVIQDGIFRDGFQGPYTFDDYVCFRQSSPLPGMIQSVVRFLEEQDV